MESESKKEGEGRIFSFEEKGKIVRKLTEEIKLRRYSDHTEKSYISIVMEFLSLGKTAREFLL